MFPGEFFKLKYFIGLTVSHNNSRFIFRLHCKNNNQKLVYFHTKKRTRHIQYFTQFGHMAELSESEFVLQ
jgi:hypothetical protein